MGMLDEALSKALPGGSSGLTKPLMIAVGSLLLGKMLSGGGSQPASSSSSSKTTQASAGGSEEGGLGGLLHNLEKVGEGNTAKSWVGKGQNAPIDPQKLGQALGENHVGQLAQQTGMNSQDLLSQLSKVLPGVIDQLTPHGKVPSQQEVAQRLGQGQQ